MGLKSIKHDTVLVLRPNIITDESLEWPKLSRIDTTNSHTFCRDCGTTLGWFLQSDTKERSMRSEWKGLMGENGND